MNLSPDLLSSVLGGMLGGGSGPRPTLPAGGQATPMTYYSAKTRRQYVVIAAGGHAGIGTQVGDYVIAYRL